MSRATLTDDEARALGERWVEAGGGWRPGMLAVKSETERRSGYTLRLVTEWAEDEWEVGGVGGPIGIGHLWPDFRDPATRGACLEVVRERRRDPATHIRPPVNGSGWRAFDGTCAPVRNAQGAPVEADGEAACLVAALEAAPR